MAASHAPNSDTLRLEAAKSALMGLHEEMRGLQPRHRAAAMGIPLIPVLFLGFLTLASPVPDDFGAGDVVIEPEAVATDVATPETAVENAGLADAEAEMAGRLDGSRPTDLSQLDAHELQQTIEVLQAIAAAGVDDPAAAAAKAHATYRADLLFHSSAILLMVFLFVTIRAQANMILAFGRPFWPRQDASVVSPTPKTAGTPKRPAPIRLWSWAFFGLGLGAFLWFVFIFAFDHVLPWLPIYDPGAAGPPVWVLAVSVLASALLYSTVVLTAFGVVMASQNYPWVDDMKSFALQLEMAREGQEKEEEKKARANTQGQSPQPLVKVAVFPPGNSTSIAKFAKAVWTVKGAGALEGQAPVECGLTPKEIVAIINSLSRALVAMLVLLLVTISLGLDAAETRLADPTAVRAAILASHDTALVTLGVALSLMFAAIYVPAIVQLNPFLEAQNDMASGGSGGPSGWIVSLGGGADSGKLFVNPARSEQPVTFPEPMEQYLGATRAKFVILVEARKYAGGYHLLLKDGLAGQLKTLAGLLAPAVAGGFLAILG